MSSEKTQEIWKQIIKQLEEKLQYAFLEQIKNVEDVNLEGDELILTISDADSIEFFKSEINSQRLILLSRPVISLENVVVKTGNS